MARVLVVAFVASASFTRVARAPLVARVLVVVRVVVHSSVLAVIQGCRPPQ